MVSAEIDYNQMEREDQAALNRWAPKGLQEVARVFGRINSGLILENRLGLSMATLRQRGEELHKRNSTLATGGAAVPRSIAPLRYGGLDLYGSELMAMMTIDVIASDYRRRPIVTTYPTVEAHAAEGSAITAGTISITNAPADSDLKPGIFISMLEWTSAARVMANPSEWTALDSALREHLVNAVLTAVFSDAKANNFTGLWHADMAANAVERRDVGNTMTRANITLEDVVALESRVARLGQIHGPVVYIADSDTWEDLGKTPRSAGDAPLRIGNEMLGRPCLPFDSVAAGKDRMLSCIAMGALELTFWEAITFIEYVPTLAAEKTYKFWSQAVLDVVKGGDNVALSYSTA